MKKPIDPIDIKVAIKNGQLIVFEKNGCVYIQDAPAGDCVCILQKKGEPIPQWRGCMDGCLPYYDGKEVKDEQVH